MEAPFYSVLGAGYSANNEITGEINYEALRQQSDMCWDVEPGDQVFIKVAEPSKSEPEVYEGFLRVRDDLTRSDDWDVFESNSEVPEDYFEKGGILMIEKPEEMEEGPWNFWTTEKAKDQQYTSVTNKLDSLFETPKPGDVSLAKQYLEMDYEKFSEGRIF